ncbi:MAG: DUF975 family protein [Lachnospiraceae bacterium]|nr:DUF975 family protein [Lachnospiraceae bacterium]
MNQYLSSASLKSLAKGQLLGKYGILTGILAMHILCVVPVTFTLSPLSGVSTLLYSAASYVVSLLSGFFIAGEAFVYLKLACSQRPLLNDLFCCLTQGSAKALKVLRIQSVLAAISVLCTLPSTYIGNSLTKSILNAEPSFDVFPFSAALFLFYAILLVAGLAVETFFTLLFSQIYYLMFDFPEYSESQLFKMSMQLIKGSKGRLFYIELSFLPLMILCLMSCGIGFLWLCPYMEATYANFYLDLVRKQSASQK